MTTASRARLNELGFESLPDWLAGELRGKAESRLGRSRDKLINPPKLLRLVVAVDPRSDESDGVDRIISLREVNVDDRDASLVSEPDRLRR